MKTNRNDFLGAEHKIFKDSYGKYIDESGGLTKREYFAAMAMQGIVSNRSAMFSTISDAEASVKMADALIAELNKETP